MSSFDRHPTLVRQLRRLGIDASSGDAVPNAAQWQAFLARVDLTYTENDQARTMLERSLELSSREMSGRLDDQRRRDEVRLLVRQRRLASIFEAIPTPLFALDGRERVVAANPAAAASFGPVRELVGRRLEEVVGDEELMAAKVVELPGDDDLVGSVVVIDPAVALARRERELAGNYR